MGILFSHEEIFVNVDLEKEVDCNENEFNENELNDVEKVLNFNKNINIINS